MAPPILGLGYWFIPQNAPKLWCQRLFIQVLVSGYIVGMDDSQPMREEFMSYMLEQDAQGRPKELMELYYMGPNTQTLWNTTWHGSPTSQCYIGLNEEEKNSHFLWDLTKITNFPIFLAHLFIWENNDLLLIHKTMGSLFYSSSMSYFFFGKFKKFLQSFILLTKPYFQSSKKNKIISYNTIVLHNGPFFS